MNEKRFELKSYGNDDLWEMKDRQGESLLTWGDIEKKLNQLAEENERLQQERRKDAKEFSALFKQNYGLKRENEQLRRYVYHCPQICNKILAYLRKSETEDVKAVSDAMDDDRYFDDDIDTLRSWE